MFDLSTPYIRDSGYDILRWTKLIVHFLFSSKTWSFSLEEVFSAILFCVYCLFQYSSYIRLLVFDCFGPAVFV